MKILNPGNFSKIWLPVLLAGSLFSSCGDDKTITNKVDFDRKAMLTHWADNIVLPAFDNFKTEVEHLDQAILTFNGQVSTTNLDAVKAQFKTTYLAFQLVKPFEMGPSEDVSFRASLNTYPADTAKIASNISNRNYNLSAASQIDARGFPAMDFLLFGNSVDLENDVEARAYLEVLVEDIFGLTKTVNQNWKAGRSTFIEASGTDIGSSLGQMVNALNKDYELIKNAKIGFPAGKKTLGKPYPHTCEAYFSGFSLELAEANIQAIHNFFRGLNFNGSQTGLSLQHYLQAIDAKHQNASLDQVIDDQFRAALEALDKVPDPFSRAVITNPTEVDAAYLEIQRNVVLLKTDMPSAMGVLITYQDNDGD